MAYIGQNADGNFTTSVSKDTFSGNGSTTAFTLSEGATTNTVDVFVENIRQEPTTAYTVDGTTLTFTAAPVSGTDNIYVVNRGPIQLSASHPAAQALTAHSATITTDLTVDTDTLYVDSTNNRVGVGTVSPDEKITVSGDIKILSTNKLHFTNTSDQTTVHAPASNTLAFTTSGSERMRIQSDGDVFIGKSSSSFGTDGIEASAALDSNGWALWATGSPTSSGGVTAFNRTGSDGLISGFYKDGTTVGSIGVTSSDSPSEKSLFIGTSSSTTLDVGLRFDPASNQIHPCDANGADRDNAIDLGGPSDRFNDIYLGGGAYIGGTGSTNYLDDYEEGTWTPVVAQGWTSVSYTNSYQNGSYTKVGNMVTAWFWMQFSGTNAGNQIRVSGLPFTVPNVTAGAYRGGAVTYFSVPTNAAGAITAYVVQNQDRIDFYAMDDGGASALSNANASSDYLIGSVTYWV
jgi:hypothetical protein